MKLLHSSDILVGLDFPTAFARAEGLREGRLEALKNLLALAARERVEFILLAGNTLADNRLAPGEWMAMVSVLETSSVPIYLLPGLRDPDSPDGPYQVCADRFKPPVHVLREAVPWRLPRATLYPCPVSWGQPGGVFDPTAWIPPRAAGDPLRIGVACVDTEGTLTAEAVRSRELDYLALGGSTVTAHMEVAHWCGTPEATRYGESRGHAHLVTLSRPTVPPRVKSVPVGRFTWLSWERTVQDVEALGREIKGLRSPHSVLMKLALQGRLSRSALHQLDELLAQLGPRFYHFQLDNRVAPGPESYIHPLLRIVERRLLARAADPEEAETARAALRKLGQMVQESPQEDLV